MSKENSSNKNTITVAIITSVTGICVAVITGIFGLQAVQMQQQAESTSAAIQIIATQSVATQFALVGTINAPTSLPLPTQTELPTNTPYPTLAFTSPPASLLTLPFSDNFSDGIASDWIVTGNFAIVNGFLHNADDGSILVLELNASFPQAYTISINYSGLDRLTSDLDCFITIGNRFRVFIEDGGFYVQWQYFDNNNWNDILGRMIINDESGNIKLNVFNNSYQLFANGQMVGLVTYGEALSGPVSISIANNFAISQVDITSP